MSRIVMVSIAIVASVSAAGAVEPQNVTAVGATNYRGRFEAQSRGIFPWMTQEQEREKWLAERELRAMENDGIDYSDKLEAMANRIFPWMSQERQRQEWIADQEHRSSRY
jgi:Leu/Phe-tRNA-protein transferase